MLNFTIYEMAFLSQVIYRINSCISVDNLSIANIIFSQLKTLIPYKKAIMSEIESVDNNYNYRKPCFFPESQEYDIMFTSTANHDELWWKYMDFSSSTVFRVSDIYDENDSIQSEFYKTVLAPQNLHYSLHATFVHDDIKLGTLILFRSKNDGDFTDKEVKYLELLKPHMELHLFRVATRFQGRKWFYHPMSADYIITQFFIDKYQLTKREVMIVSPLLSGIKDADICERLGISKSTLEKHIHNIYKKVGANNRASLFQKFKNHN